MALAAQQAAAQAARNVRRRSSLAVEQKLAADQAMMRQMAEQDAARDLILQIQTVTADAKGLLKTGARIGQVKYHSLLETHDSNVRRVRPCVLKG